MGKGFVAGAARSGAEPTMMKTGFPPARGLSPFGEESPLASFLHASPPDKEAPQAETEGPTAPRSTGTTTLGITTREGTVLATEHRATAGHLISHKDTQKLFRIEEHLGLTIAGLVGDAQALARDLRTQATIYRLKNDRPISIKGAAIMMSNMMNQMKFSPYEVALLIGGWDRRGAQVYSIDEAGGAMPDKWTTTGSGSPFVYGVLEDHFKEGLSLSDAIDLAIRGLNASTRRDSASGNGMEIATFGPKGYANVPRDEIDRRLKKLGLPPIPL